MALRFAILTSLAEREASGFELAKRFDRVFGYFWAASHQQIYRELDRLSTAELIAEAPQPPRAERGQPKRFAITTAGTTALRNWVREIDDPAKLREPLIVRVRAAATVGDLDGLREAVGHHLQIHERAYAEYKAIEERDFATVDTDADVLRHLVLKSGIGMERSWVEWCREAIDTIDELQRRTTV
ncbi:PadR family transcriptional regulator [Nocardia sp. NPDC058176]|uniref:PadR family transcriptional regulator n=1 Tax=Nocardia sp. NPDC058176 TaxID=3346368 RepID=UPI0036DD2700